jgi:hypothetical protein
MLAAGFPFLRSLAMAAKKLREAPITIDADAIAEGLLEMFTDEERTVLRFGMLPAHHMERLERALRNKFEEYAAYRDGEECVAMLKDDQDKAFVRFRMDALVREAMRKVTLALYDIGDLVV